LVAVLAFAVKTGLGWAYLWQTRRPGEKLWPTLAVPLLYALLFALVLFLVKKIDLLSNYQVIEPLWRGGQTIHWLIALLMFTWGLILMRHKDYQEQAEEDFEAPVDNPGAGEETGPGKNPEHSGQNQTSQDLTDQSQTNQSQAAQSQKSQKPCPGPASGVGKGRPGSYGFLALIIPCPVCLSVVTMSLACLVMYFPNQALMGTLILYGGFLVVAALSGLSLILGFLGPGENLERSLGLAMTTIAAYFMISALVLPQFGQIDRVYRLASYAQETEKNLPISGPWLVAIVLALAFFGAAFGRFRWKKNSQ
jgi:predicted transporter